MKNFLSDNGKPLVMGILNVTPDSFSDGGQFLDFDTAVTRALQMVAEGADIIDVGGESSGPSSGDVSLEQELERVMPVLKLLRKRTDVMLSIDTYKSEVALQALNAGVDMVNDVTALRGDEKMASTLAAFDVPVVMMYSKDSSARTTRRDVQYDDVITTVRDFLEERIEYGVRAGIAGSRFILDPGMGAFVSSDPQYSFQILKRLGEFKDFGLPLLVGPSRKSFLSGKLDERLEGSLAACAVAVLNGASIVRVHDVQQTRRVVDMVHAIKNS